MKNILKVIIATILIAGCSEAKKLSKQADSYYYSRQYEQAISYAVNSIKLGNKKAAETLEKAYSNCEKDILSKINYLSESSSTFKNDNTVYEREQIANYYGKLISFQKNIKSAQRYAPDMSISFKDYGTKYNEAVESYNQARETAAENHYQEGIRLAQKSGSEQLAANEFKKALSFVPNYKDAMSLQQNVLNIERTNNAEKFYKEGQQFENKGGLENYKRATKAYKEAMRYVSNYKDAQQRYEKCKEKGTTNICIEPFVNQSSNRYAQGLDRMVSDKIISKIEGHEFIKIVNRENLQNVVREINIANAGIQDENSQQAIAIEGFAESVNGYITYIDIDPPNETSVGNWTESGKYIIGYREAQNDSERIANLLNGGKVPVYANGSVQVYKYLVSASGKMSVSYKIVDFKTQRTIISNNYSQPYNFSEEYARFVGDEKVANGVLTASSSALCRKEKPQAPAENQIIEYFVEQISTKIANDIISHINNY